MRKCVRRRALDDGLLVPAIKGARVLLQALEYQMQQGIADAARTEAFLMPLSVRHAHGAELHADAAVLRLLQY